MSEKPKALPGDAPKREEPKIREHDWTGGASPDKFGTPSWVNNPSGNIKTTCSRCGCELITGSIVFADVKISNGSEYTYRLATGQVIRSFKPLSCPLFVFDGLSGAVEAKEVGREAKIEAEKVDIRVDETQLRLTQLEAENRALHAATEARVVQLEAENRALREQVGTVTQIDLGTLAQKIFELAQAAKEKKALEAVETEGGVFQVPKELVDVIDVVGIPVEKKALPPADDDGDDEDDDDQ